jgi:hypothetical protein
MHCPSWKQYWLDCQVIAKSKQSFHFQPPPPPTSKRNKATGGEIGLENVVDQDTARSVLKGLRGGLYIQLLGCDRHGAFYSWVRSINCILIESRPNETLTNEEDKENSTTLTQSTSTTSEHHVRWRYISTPAQVTALHQSLDLTDEFERSLARSLTSVLNELSLLMVTDEAAVWHSRLRPVPLKPESDCRTVLDDVTDAIALRYEVEDCKTAGSTTEKSKIHHDKEETAATQSKDEMSSVALGSGDEATSIAQSSNGKASVGSLDDKEPMSNDGLREGTESSIHEEANSKLVVPTAQQAFAASWTLLLNTVRQMAESVQKIDYHNTRFVANALHSQLNANTFDSLLASPLYDANNTDRSPQTYFDPLCTILDLFGSALFTLDVEDCFYCDIVLDTVFTKRSSKVEGQDVKTLPPRERWRWFVHTHIHTWSSFILFLWHVDKHARPLLKKVMAKRQARPSRESSPAERAVQKVYVLLNRCIVRLIVVC